MVAKVAGWLRKTQQCPFCWAGSDGGMQESLEKMLVVLDFNHTAGRKRRPGVHPDFV